MCNDHVAGRQGTSWRRCGWDPGSQWTCRVSHVPAGEQPLRDRFVLSLNKMIRHSSLGKPLDILLPLIGQAPCCLLPRASWDCHVL